MKTLINVIAASLLACAFLSAQDPLQTNNDALRAALTAKKSPAEIKKLAVLVISEAKKQMGPAPANMEKDSWDEHAKYAQEVSEFAEYALYAASVGAPPAAAIDMITTLEAESPKSKYLNQDAFLLVANAALTAQQADRAAAYARKSLSAPKGANAEAAETNAHYIVGVVEFTKNNFAVADKELKAAVPGLKAIASISGPVYYYLGWAEYRVGRQSMSRNQADQGIKYEMQCAAIPGQYQQQALAAAGTMKKELGEK